MKVLQLHLFAFLMCVIAPATAVIETYDFSAPELEQRYQKLSAELRCPKCQNQNIADSNAPIAQDLRKLLHQQLEEGASDEQILGYMEQRYGEFVLYRPKFSGVTTILWLAPVVLLLLGLSILVFTIRRRSSGASTEFTGLSAEESKHIESLLNSESPDH